MSCFWQQTSQTPDAAILLLGTFPTYDSAAHSSPSVGSHSDRDAAAVRVFFVTPCKLTADLCADGRSLVLLAALGRDVTFLGPFFTMLPLLGHWLYRTDPPRRGH